MAARQRPYTIVYEDDNLLVVDKAAGIPVIPERVNTAAVALNRQLQNRYGKGGEQAIWVVHRIDRDTSGLVLFARNPQAHRAYSGLFQEKTIQKRYLAISRGHAPDAAGEIDAPIRISQKGRAVIDAHRGKPSLTRFYLQRQYRQYTAVWAEPETGRQHQIRIHLKSIGLPLAVDPLYGSAGPIDLSMIKRGYRYKKDEAPRPLISRLSLHCARLNFTDPLSGEERSFNADIPGDMRALIKSLDRWGDPTPFESNLKGENHEHIQSPV